VTPVGCLSQASTHETVTGKVALAQVCLRIIRLPPVNISHGRYIPVSESAAELQPLRLVYIVACLVGTVVSCLVCIVVVLCVFVALCVYCCFYFRYRSAG